MTGVIVFLKQESHSDDVISSRPQESEESFCHSFLHLMHFTRILFMPFPRSELSSLYYVRISIMAGKIKGYRTSNRGNKLEKNTRGLTYLFTNGYPPPVPAYSFTSFILT